MNDIFEARLWSYVDMGGPDECWLWCGRSLSGPLKYGSIKRQGRKIRSHRSVYESVYGPIPAGLMVRHTCDVPLCCNPNHLLIGTAKQNSDDKIERGRWRGCSRPGQSNPRAIITNVDAMDISERAKTRSYATVAREFGVSKSTVAFIAQGRTWRSVTQQDYTPTDGGTRQG